MTRRSLGRAVLAWSLLGLMLPGVAEACSGPGAAEAIAQAERMALGMHLLAGLLVVVATVVARRRRVLGSPVAAGWFLLIAHPNLWTSARSGDCGQQLEVSSILFTTLAAGLLVYVAWRPVPPEPPEGGGDEDDEDDEDRGARGSTEP